MPGRAGAEPNGLDTTSNVAACPEAGVSRRSLLRAAGLGLVGLLACWIAVVLYWRVVDIQPTAGHIVAYRVLLPLGLLCGVLLLRPAWRRMRTRDTTQPEPAKAETADGGGGTGVERAVDRTLYLLAGAAWMRAGDTPLAVAGALARPHRPALHPQLRDAVGLPVFAAEVEGLDPTVAERWLATDAGSEGGASRGIDTETLRAIALLDTVAEDLLFAALPVLAPDHSASDATDGALHPHAMHHSRSARAAPPSAAPAVLRVQLLLPSDWPAETRAACAEGLRRKARAVGYPEADLCVTVCAVEAAADVWRVLDAIDADPGAPGAGDRHLLLAAHSLVGQAAINRLDARHELLVDGVPEGRIPGEGAAGILLAPTLPAASSGPLPPRLHRPVRGMAGRGRAASRSTAVLLQAALDAAGCPNDDVALVFSDADHRPSRAIEIAGAITAALPELEPIDHARHLGLACGDTGPVGPLALLASAAAHVQADGVPALAMSLADRDARVAVLLSPAPTPAQPDDSSTGSGSGSTSSPAATPALA